MSKSLAELRASTRTALPERSYQLCLSQALVAEVQSLEEERAAIGVTADRDEDNIPPRKMSEGPDPRLAEIADRLEALFDEMREHTGELRLRGTSAGEWRRFVDANPPREKNAIDDAVTYGFCHAGALMDALGTFAVSWNGDAMGEGDWDFIANRAAAGDLKELCKIVVQMHETAGARAPGKSPSPLSPTQTSETA